MAPNQITLKEKLAKRWCREEYPGGTPRFEPKLLAKDIAVFALLPTCAALALRAVSGGQSSSKSKRLSTLSASDRNTSTAQIINFEEPKSPRVNRGSMTLKRTAGTLVRVRLLNTVETFEEAPVHARILDKGLGHVFQGGTLIGKAISDPNSGRIKVDFILAKYPNSDSIAEPMAARALALNGTLGIEGSKKEGFFARATLRAGSGNKAGVDETGDFKTLVARAVANGLMQEFSDEMSAKSAQAQVYALTPGAEFFVELTDVFPSSK
jgi:hypothetical protein